MYNCEDCKNHGKDHEKYDFRYNNFYARDDWDILELDDDIEWSHIQIQKRLAAKGVIVIFADMFFNDMVFIFGCYENISKIATILNIYQQVIYNDFEHGLIIINLKEEKALRMGLDIDRLYEEFKDSKKVI